MKRVILLIALLMFLATGYAMAATVPETIPHPFIAARYNNGFYLMVKKVIPGGSTQYWSAPYLYSTPYVPNTGWLAGDRVAYNCAYAFLQHNGTIVGRVTFHRIAGASSYAQIVDKFMSEGQRFYDGSLTPISGEGNEYRDCPSVSQSYETVVTPDERPKVVYWSGATNAALGVAIEIRDYLTVQPSLPNITFDLVDVISTPFQITTLTSGVQTVNSRVAVLAREAGVPFAVVYYDGIGYGQVTEEACAVTGCPSPPVTTTTTAPATTTTACIPGSSACPTTTAGNSTN